jgi:histidinol-phosphate/aromatic aminotransferase/cobyric acid decarboxylase-like protein
MSFSAYWMYILAVLGGLIAGFRIWQNLQKRRRQKNDSWDERLIDQLRKRGSDPFKPHDVDFFLAFPKQEGAEDLARQLRAEGFDADVVDEPESGELRWSLHLHKSMQLTVPDMKELSRRLTDAATQRQGRYDGWSAKQVPKPTDIADRMR